MASSFTASIRVHVDTFDTVDNKHAYNAAQTLMLPCCVYKDII